MSDASPPRFEFGCPWTYDLPISEMTKDRLVASQDMRGATWLKKAAIILGLLTALFIFLFWVTLNKKPTAYPAIISVSLFSLLITGAFVGVIGLFSYKTRLTIDKDRIRFERTFFWRTQITDEQRTAMHCLKAWIYQQNISNDPPPSPNHISECHLCLHFQRSLPSISLLCVEYLPDHGKTIGEGFSKVGISPSNQLPDRSYDEAAELVTQKGNQLADLLDIPFITDPDDPTAIHTTPLEPKQFRLGRFQCQIHPFGCIIGGIVLLAFIAMYVVSKMV